MPVRQRLVGSGELSMVIGYDLISQRWRPLTFAEAVERGHLHPRALRLPNEIEEFVFAS